MDHVEEIINTVREENAIADNNEHVTPITSKSVDAELLSTIDKVSNSAIIKNELEWNAKVENEVLTGMYVTYKIHMNVL